ncbi:MAG: hypothetical protein MUD08_11855 [Cytophagales bacterium]|nr:hypothetical protein [Cytophagales bacterium]
MKKTLLLAATLLAIIAWKAADILSDLSLTQAQLENATLKTAQTGLKAPDWRGLQLTSFVGKAKALPAGSQASAVKSLGALVKSYVMSERFKKQWQDDLAKRNIYDPKAKGDYARLEEQRKAAAQQQKSAASSEQNMNDAYKQMAQMMKDNPQMAETMKQQMTKEQWAEFQQAMKGNGNKQMADDQKQAAQDYAKAIKDEEKRIQDLQKLWDENQHSAMVKRYLQQFIQTAGSVDFAAELKNGKYGKKEFANPAYEKKSDLWKQLYRAGKEPTMAARDFAQQWLNGMK